MDATMFVVWHLKASCDPADTTCPVHDGLYPLIRFGAEALWAINRTLLAVAYDADHMRRWLIGEGLEGSYTLVAGQMLIPLRIAASLALVLFVLGYLLLPWLNIRLVALRRVLTALLAASVLLPSGGALLHQIEVAREGLSETLLAGTRALGLRTAGPLQRSVYDANARAICGMPGLPLRRPNERRADDVAAAFLFANAIDIHCPEQRPPNLGLPNGFFASGRYFIAGGIGSLNEQERSHHIDAALNGMLRQLLGLLPCAVAALERMTHLLLSLALAAAALSVPPALLAGLFLSTDGILAGILRRLARLIVLSWTISLLQGLTLALLLQAADNGNDGRLLAVSLICLVMCAALARAAGRALLDLLYAARADAGRVARRYSTDVSIPIAPLPAPALVRLPPTESEAQSSGKVYRSGTIAAAMAQTSVTNDQ